MKTYEVLDLFCGIGGIRLGLEGTGRFKVVHACEIDDRACKTYEANFGHSPKGDVTRIDPTNLPHFDVVAAGFPCQAFSIAGNRLGFEEARGTLFFDVARVIAARRPRAALFENVKGLLSHNSGDTFKRIRNTLVQMGYGVFHKVLNAKNFGVPQNRERVYIVALRDWEESFPDGMGFDFPSSSPGKSMISEIMEESPVSDKHYLSQKYLDGLRLHRQRQETKGRGFGYEIMPVDGPSHAIVCGGMGKERNLIVDARGPSMMDGKNSEHVRSMTPREWARLQGFPDSFKIAATWAHKQFGNSVAVPVIKAIGGRLAEALDARDES
jgi:DNA (cytosine-5)-methyltransferase 1